MNRRENLRKESKICFLIFIYFSFIYFVFFIYLLATFGCRSTRNQTLHTFNKESKIRHVNCYFSSFVNKIPTPLHKFSRLLSRYLAVRTFQIHRVYRN